MKILLISRGYMSKEDPVLGNFEAEQAFALKRAGHDVIIASIDRRVFRKHFRKIGISKIVDKGIAIYNFYFPLYAPIIKRNPLIPFCFSDWFYQKMMLRLYKKIERENWRPDIVYAHYLFNSHMALPLKEQLSIPFVAIEHWSHLNNDVLSQRVRKLGNDVYYHVDKVLSVSLATSNRLRQHFDIDSPVCYNMIDNKSFTYLPNRSSNSKMAFVTVGRNQYRKGFDVLIEALNRMDPKIDCSLHVIGSGDWGDIELLVDKYGLNDKVKFWGALDERSDVVKIMRESDVFVLPSRKETFGVVYVEAMMMGLPVIATPCRGPEEYVNETNGLLVPIDDVDKLASAMEYMAVNHCRYDGKVISEEVNKLFSPETIADQLINVFNEVLDKYRK